MGQGLHSVNFLRARGGSTWTFLSACPGMGQKEEVGVGLESCQQSTSKMESDSITHENPTRWK